MISTSIDSSVKEFNMDHVPWKTFKTHIRCTLGDLRTKGHFADVSLVCDDQIQKSERAGPHPIGQKGQLVKRSLGPKS